MMSVFLSTFWHFAARLRLGAAIVAAGLLAMAGGATAARSDCMSSDQMSDVIFGGVHMGAFISLLVMTALWLTGRMESRLLLIPIGVICLAFPAESVVDVIATDKQEPAALSCELDDLAHLDGREAIST